MIALAGRPGLACSNVRNIHRRRSDEIFVEPVFSFTVASRIPRRRARPLSPSPRRHARTSTPLLLAFPHHRMFSLAERTESAFK